MTFKMADAAIRDSDPISCDNCGWVGEVKGTDTARVANGSEAIWNLREDEGRFFWVKEQRYYYCSKCRALLMIGWEQVSKGDLGPEQLFEEFVVWKNQVDIEYVLDPFDLALGWFSGRGFSHETALKMAKKSRKDFGGIHE